MKNKSSVTFKYFKKSLFTNMLTMLLPMLIIVCHSFFHIVGESTENARRNDNAILSEVDRTIEDFFTDIDNAFLILATDADMSRLLSSVFEENNASLNSIKFTEILAANFRNIVFTNDYVQNIYFYLNNDENKILSTLNKRTTILSEKEFEHIALALSHDSSDDIWFETYPSPPIDIGQDGQTLQIYRRLYYRATKKQSGLIIYSISLDKIKTNILKQFNYADQVLLAFDSNGNLFFTIGNEKLVSLDNSLVSIENFKEKSIVTLSGNRYFISSIKSERNYGPSYVLLTPINDIYRYAITFLTVAIVIFLCVLIATALIAYFKTKREHARVDRVIKILSNPDSISDIEIKDSENSDPFSYIQFNIMKLFLEQDYLKMQNLQKSTQLQLSQIQALQHQINPHFLNNTLNIIYWKAIQLGNGENECSSMIQSLSDVMRYSLGNPQEDAILRDEIDFIKKYISLMKKRFPNTFDEVFEIDENCLDIPIKKMLLQPLVENAITHGLRSKQGKGKLIISAQNDKNSVCFLVYDNGIGIPPLKLKQLKSELESVSVSAKDLSEFSSDHIGIINTHLRLVMTYGTNSGLNIESREGEYTKCFFCI